MCNGLLLRRNHSPRPGVATRSSMMIVCLRFQISSVRPGIPIACLLLLTACGGVANGEPSVQPSMASVSQNGPLSDTKLDSVALSLDKYCDSSFPDLYSGVAVRQANHSLLVYRRPAPGFDAIVSQRFSGTRISFSDARFSRKDLRQLAGQILTDEPSWRRRGVDIQTVTPLVDGSAVQIGPPPATRAKVPLEAQYGPDRVRVVKISVD